METYTTFNQSMANAAAIAGATGADYQKLNDAARAAGKATSFTAAESADALGYMALAGWDVATSTKALTPVLKLAEATQADLATTSDQVTDSMSAMGVGVDDLQGYLDVLVKTNNKANTTAGDLMEAFKGAGGAVQATGMNYKDAAVALGILANNGVKGAEAGTALNSMLVRMSSKDVALKTFKKLGVQVYDSAGAMRDMRDILIDTDKAMSGMTEAERNANMAALAGTNYYTDFQYLLQGIRGGADGSASAWDNLADEVYNAGGALEAMDATVTGTLQGAMDRMNSALDDAKISFMEAFGPSVAAAMDWISSNVLPRLSDAMTRVSGYIQTNVVPAVQSCWHWIQDNLSPVFRGLKDTLTNTVIPAIKDLWSWMKNSLGPVFDSLGGAITGTVVPALSDFFNWTSDSAQMVQDMTGFLQEHKTAFEVAAIAVGALGTALLLYNGQAIAAAIGSGAETAALMALYAWETITTVATTALSTAMAFLTSPVTLVIAAIAAVVAIGAVLYNNWDTLVQKCTELANTITERFPWMASIVQGAGATLSMICGGIRDVFSGLITFIKGVFSANWRQAWEGVKSIFSGVFRSLVGIAAAPLNAIISAINTVIGGLNSLHVSIPKWVPKYGGQTFSLHIPTIPNVALAEGGIATAPTTALIGEGGEPEAVIPLSKLSSMLDGLTGGRGEITFSPTIYVSSGASKEDVRDAMSQTFEQFKEFMAQYEREQRRTSFA